MRATVVHGGRPGSPGDSPQGPDRALDGSAVSGTCAMVNAMTNSAASARVVAAVQAAPVFLDRDATIEKVGTLTKEAAGAGARLVAFPEGFVPDVPRLGLAHEPVGRRRVVRPLDRPVRRRARSRVRRARRHRARERGASRRSGERTRRRHRLQHASSTSVPTARCSASTASSSRPAASGSRGAWATARRCPVFDTPFGRLGGLICWENYMPLARAAMYEQGVDILLAPTWDNSDVWVASMRHIAKEGRCYVLGITSCLRGSDVPADIPGRDDIYGGDDDWMSRGNTVIVDPYGDILAGPISETEGILYAEVDVATVRQSRRQFDVVGHYAAPRRVQAVRATRLTSTDASARGRTAGTSSVSSRK